jgi:hypothetical protein
VVEAPGTDVAIGAVGGFNAIATSAGSGTKDVTFLADWTSSDTSVVTITPSGIGRAMGSGQSRICATYEAAAGCVSVGVRP